MNEDAIWERSQPLPVGALTLIDSAALQPVSVQDHIHLISAVWTTNRHFPGRFEALIIGMAALRSESAAILGANPCFDMGRLAQGGAHARRAPPTPGPAGYRPALAQVPVAKTG